MDASQAQICFFALAIYRSRRLQFFVIQPKTSSLRSTGFQRVRFCQRSGAGALHFVMRSLLEVLRQKEIDLARVRQEVEALRFVAPLLLEGDDQFRDRLEVLWPETPPKNRWPLEVDELPRISPGL